MSNKLTKKYNGKNFRQIPAVYKNKKSAQSVADFRRKKGDYYRIKKTKRAPRRKPVYLVYTRKKK